jgi:hypothetical protein
MQEKEDTASALPHVARRQEYSRAEEVQNAHISSTCNVLSITLNVLHKTNCILQYIALKLFHLQQFPAYVYYTQVAKNG